MEKKQLLWRVDSMIHFLRGASYQRVLLDLLELQDMLRIEGDAPTDKSMLSSQPQAFPGYDESAKNWVPGMTLRDHFAGNALQALLGNTIMVRRLLDQKAEKKERFDMVVAKEAYGYADAMIQARNTQPKEKV